MSSARGQAEAVVDQHLLAGAVAVVHAAHLGQRHVRLVDEQQEVVGEVVEQRPGRARPGPGAARWRRVVLDAGAVADLAQHLQVVSWCAARSRAASSSLPSVLQLGQPLLQLGLDVLDGLLAASPAVVTKCLAG